MWELICHHQYTSSGAIAVDRSPYHSDGFASEVTTLPGGAGLGFLAQRSKVSIPRRPDDPWGYMRAVHVELVVASGLSGGGGVIIDASPAFLAVLDGPHRLTIDILGTRQAIDLTDLPPGTWVNVSFTHDGVSSFTYGYGFELASGLGSGMGGTSPITVPGQVPPVGLSGVTIGNRSSGVPQPLRGGIQSLKVWRANPRTVVVNLLGRPFDPGLGECWGSLIDRFNDAAAKDPECAGFVVAGMERIFADVARKVSHLSPDKLAELRRMCATYQTLWSSGQAGSQEMQGLLATLRDWLKNEHLLSNTDPQLQAFLNHPCFKHISTTSGGLECDNEVQVLLTGLIG